MASYTSSKASQTISSKADSVDFTFDISSAITSANIPAYSKITRVNITVWGDINTATNTGKMKAYFGSEQIGSETKVGGTANEKSVSEDISVSTFFNSGNANAGKLKDSSVRITVNINGPIMLSKFNHTASWQITIEWQPPVTAIFKNYDGTELARQTVVYGSTPSYTGATPASYFSGWQYKNTFSGWDKELDAITANTTYTAVFTQTLREYKIMPFNDGVLEQGVSISGFGTYKYGDTVTLTAEPPLHRFTSWSTDNREIFEGSTLTFKLTDETLAKWCQISNGEYYIHNETLIAYIRIYVSFPYKTYTINFNSTPEDYGFVEIGVTDSNGNPVFWFEIDSEEDSYPYAGRTIRATPNQGYKFVKWSDGVTDNPRRIATDGNYTYTAIFEKDWFNVEINQPDAKVGTITGAVSGVYEYGTELTLTANINYGYVFKYWSIIGEILSTDNPVTFVVKQDTEVNIDYDALPKYYWTFTSIGNGKIMGAETGYYYDGTELSITAVPDEGHKFVKWEDGSTESTRTVVIDKNATNKTIAYFEKLPPKFTSAEMKYLDKQISSSNKVFADEGFIIAVGIT